MSWKMPIALRNIVGRKLFCTKINAMRNSSPALIIDHIKIPSRLVEIWLTAYMRTRLPSQIAGIIYTRNMVNGQKMTPWSTAPMLGMKASGRALDRDNFRAAQIKRRLTMLPMRSCGPASKRGRKNNTQARVTVRCVGVTWSRRSAWSLVCMFLFCYVIKEIREDYELKKSSKTIRSTVRFYLFFCYVQAWF